MSEFSHFNAAGEAHMVDVGEKPQSRRRALTEGRISMQPETLAMIMQGGHKKGDVLGIARIAGIMAAKRAPELIPLCHPLSLTKVTIDFEVEAPNNSIRCRAHVETLGQTGVEIEAL
ncbi:MAG: cyclic pyranopterin monophosphate synthase MoaC, partial [Chromatiales bacterium]